jgi:hypothetical protein
MQQNAAPRSAEKSPPDTRSSARRKNDFLNQLLTDPELSSQLSPRQHEAINLSLQGLTDAQVAQQINVNRATLYRWRTSNPWFRAELHRRRRAIWASCTDRLRSMIAPALDIIQSQITSPDPRTALRAAAILIRHAAPRATTLKPHADDADPVKQLLEDLDDEAYPLDDDDPALDDDDRDAPTAKP